MRMEGGEIKVKGVTKVVEDYFRKIFASPSSSQMDIDRATRGLSVHVDEEMNRRLIEPFSEEEIKEALFNMGHTKAPNGFRSIFYQTF
ncbi:hypothetical protein PanWU01x14_011900 [Parasponia andersonii]|uniref:Uncharacterized protein n=1 Tax=Parasponia andersonii TaxID=3476 RepID=A0A2P5E1N3_PARAD|nr:hypothetical protein PanWU01x14_011900 [Parasponia andersonii]